MTDHDHRMDDPNQTSQWKCSILGLPYHEQCEACMPYMRHLAEDLGNPATAADIAQAVVATNHKFAIELVVGAHNISSLSEQALAASLLKPKTSVTGAEYCYHSRQLATTRLAILCRACRDENLPWWLSPAERNTLVRSAKSTATCLRAVQNAISALATKCADEFFRDITLTQYNVWGMFPISLRGHAPLSRPDLMRYPMVVKVPIPALDCTISVTTYHNPPSFSATDAGRTPPFSIARNYAGHAHVVNGRWAHVPAIEASQSTLYSSDFDVPGATTDAERLTLVAELLPLPFETWSDTQCAFFFHHKRRLKEMLGEAQWAELLDLAHGVDLGEIFELREPSQTIPKGFVPTLLEMGRPWVDRMALSAICFLRAAFGSRTVEVIGLLEGASLTISDGERCPYSIVHCTEEFLSVDAVLQTLAKCGWDEHDTAYVVDLVYQYKHNHDTRTANTTNARDIISMRKDNMLNDNHHSTPFKTRSGDASLLQLSAEAVLKEADGLFKSRLFAESIGDPTPHRQRNRDASPPRARRGTDMDSEHGAVQEWRLATDNRSQFAHGDSRSVAGFGAHGRGYGGRRG